MTAENWGALTLVLLGFGIAAGLVAWTSSTARRVFAPAALLMLVAAAVVAAAPPSVVVDDDAVVALVALAGVLAVAGGGPIAALVFDLVDRREPDGETMREAAHVLRGGAWIGGLERIAVYAAIVAGWPEGLAIVLGVKSLARYPELRTPGTAERFIIGTFVSVLWAAGCAGVVLLVR
ncbi:hypothetical protein [Nocardioides caricicola]|uniref:Uncharacterized protein n=1 Tax=Nocardioides caricicola TaxID=634770 RepID=A0ABW0N1Z9_9ACTN